MLAMCRRWLRLINLSLGMARRQTQDSSCFLEWGYIKYIFHAFMLMCRDMEVQQSVKFRFCRK